MRQLISQIQRLRLPLKLDSGIQIKHNDLFRGATSNIEYLRCHASILSRGLPPHPPHRHTEEEILVLLQGEVNVVIPDADTPEKLHQHRLKIGQGAYYPAGFRHTIETVSEEPASYIMFKWHGSASKVRSPQAFKIYTLFSDPAHSNNVNPIDIRTKLIFESGTSYLKRLHCHTTELVPSASYNAHSDKHDVAIIVFHGELETLGQIAKPYDIIFYKSGDMHGMSNIGEKPAFYAVLEFHGEKSRLWPGFQNLKRIRL